MREREREEGGGGGEKEENKLDRGKESWSTLNQEAEKMAILFFE